MAIRLSELIGTPVSVPGGPIGRVVDVTLHLGGGDATIDRLLIGTRRRAHAVANWSDIESIEASGAVLRATASIDSAPPVLADDELRLGRDVLDTQIVDIDGRRLARVGDVLLERTGSGPMSAAAVDVGFGIVIRRLGLRSLGDRLPERAVAWDSVHLTSARGHAVQLATPLANLHRLDADEVAVLLAAIATGPGAEVLQAVHPDVAAAALDRLPAEHAGRLLPTRSRVPRRRFRRHHGWHRRLPLPQLDDSGSETGTT